MCWIRGVQPPSPLAGIPLPTIRPATARLSHHDPCDLAPQLIQICAIPLADELGRADERDPAGTVAGWPPAKSAVTAEEVPAAVSKMARSVVGCNDVIGLTWAPGWYARRAAMTHGGISTRDVAAPRLTGSLSGRPSRPLDDETRADAPPCQQCLRPRQPTRRRYAVGRHRRCGTRAARWSRTCAAARARPGRGASARRRAGNGFDVPARLA